jgi:hypothetical protein
MGFFNLNIQHFLFRTKVKVSSSDTVQQVKSKIKEAHDINVNEQELFLGREKLENEKTLANYKIESNETVRLVQTLTGGFQIYVSFSGKSVSLQVLPSYTIKKVKEEFEIKQGMPVAEQRYIYNGKELENNRVLSDYNIKDADTLYVVMRLSGGEFINKFR